MSIVAIAKRKGGVVKTTTHNVETLAHVGKKVLMVDLDTQDSLAIGD